ncbi:MAG: hypothetical protein FWK04_08535 [Nostoc sp. GBBB01]|nr:hypothetical protein [Nostoc sp. GBBB01]
MSDNQSQDNQKEPPKVRVVGVFCSRCDSSNTCFYWDEHNQTYSYKCRTCGHLFSRNDDEFF